MTQSWNRCTFFIGYVELSLEVHRCASRVSTSIANAPQGCNVLLQRPTQASLWGRARQVRGSRTRQLTLHLAGERRWQVRLEF